MSLDLIVEVGNSHEGSLGIATSFVDIAKDVGANCVKFQMHLPEFESSDQEPFRKKFSIQDKSRIDYWNRVGFSFAEWQQLISYTHQAGLEFLCTPFSVEAAEWLFQNGRLKRWKVGSGEATNFPLLKFLIDSELPILISLGLVSWDEIHRIKDFFTSHDAWSRVTLMHCVSQYPTPLEHAALNLIDELRKLDVKVGLSDHSGDVAVPLRAIAMGVNTVEVHLAPHKRFFGPDTAASLLSDDLAFLVKIANKWNLLDSSPVSRENMYNQSEEIRKIFKKGVYWKTNLPKAHTIMLDDLAFLKPSSEISAMDYLEVIGKKTLVPVNAKSPVSKSEIGD